MVMALRSTASYLGLPLMGWSRDVNGVESEIDKRGMDHAAASSSGNHPLYSNEMGTGKIQTFLFQKFLIFYSQLNFSTHNLLPIRKLQLMCQT